MAHAWFRFYAELGELLRPAWRGRDILHAFRPPAPVKDRIEALGVPHTEVELVLVDGEPVGFDHRVPDGARVSVYPFLSLVGSPRPLRPPPPRGRFALDQHLTPLAAYLRLLGLDALHRPSIDDAELVAIGRAEDRVVLTRDRGLLMRRELVHGHFVRAREPKAQVPEVLHRFGQGVALAPFTRCLRCNVPLHHLSRSDAAPRLLPGTLAHYDAFQACPACGRVFWDGPHAQRMRGWVEAWRDGRVP